MSRVGLRLLAICFLSLGCDGAADLPSAPAPESIIGGCLELADRTCSLEAPTQLHAWLDVHGATPLRVLADGEPIPSAGRVVAAGVRLSFEIPLHTESLQIEAADATWDPPITLAFHWRPGAPETDAPDIETLLQRARNSSGWVQLRLLDHVRRQLDESPKSVEVGARELQVAREIGATQHQAQVLGAQAHFLIEKAGDLPAARARLDQLEPFTTRSPLAKSRWHYYRGLLARRSGDLGAALDHLTTARTLYEKLGDPGVLDPLEMEAVTLAELGRVDDAEPLRRKAFEASRASALGCDAFVRRANNIGWADLVLNSGGQGDSDPRPMLTDGLGRIEECPNAWFHTSLLLELAMAEYQQGSPTAALGWLAKIEGIEDDLRVWVEEIDARASGEYGDPTLQRPLLERPLPTSDVEQIWNQSVRQADALARWGFMDLAATEYRAAEAQLSQSLDRVGIDTRSELYLSGRTASLEGLVDALLDLGRPAEASCAIRLARARGLARLDRTARLQGASVPERDAWEREMFSIAAEQKAVGLGRAGLWKLSTRDRERAGAQLARRDQAGRGRLDNALRDLGIEPIPRTCDDLRAPREGEVILVVYASLAFASSASGVEVAPLGRLGDLDSLGRANRISIIEVGDQAQVAIHTLAWRDSASLLDVAPVAYSLDLRPRPSSNAPQASALVIADPRNDLPKSRDEAVEVTRILKEQGWSVTEAMGEQARRSLFLEELPRVALLHYAGHGVREGAAGWDSALLLADDEQLRVPDVFTLPAVPRGVVLTGCETAAATPQTVGGGMNIGRAFVLSGSDWVIASDAEVSDHHAAEVGIAMHDSRSDSADGPARLRDALLSLRNKDPEAPWQHFRAITP